MRRHSQLEFLDKQDYALSKDSPSINISRRDDSNDTSLGVKSVIKFEKSEVEKLCSSSPGVLYTVTTLLEVFEGGDGVNLSPSKRYSMTDPYVRHFIREWVDFVTESRGRHFNLTLP